MFVVTFAFDFLNQPQLQIQIKMNSSPNPRRWTLPESPIDYFRAQGQDYFACPKGLFQMTDETVLDMIEPMDQDSEDMFAISDMGKELIEAFI